MFICKLTLLGKKKRENREVFYLFNIIPLFSCIQSADKSVYRIFGFKITHRKNKFSNQELIQLNKTYENGCGTIPNVKNKSETLDTLVNSNNSIARYGDGEFSLIFGQDISFQKFSPILQQKLKEILIEKNNILMVAIPDIFGSLEHYSTGSANFWRKLVVNTRSRTYNFIDLNKQYFDACVSRPYMNAKDKSGVKTFFEKFKKVWENKNIVLVEGKMSRMGMGNDLFSNAASVKRIICPTKNAFTYYDKIIAECKKQPADTLFIIALGPTATVLASDLSKNGFRALDLGHIDIEYEWFLRNADKKIPIKNKYVNEVKKGRVNTNLNDSTYLEQIIKIIE